MSMLKQFSWVAGGRIVAAILQLLSLGLLAVWVNPSTFGLVASVVAIAIVPQSILDFGISTYVVRHRAATPLDGTVPYALRINNRISLILSIASAFAILALGFMLDSTFLWMLPLSIWIGAERNADVWLGVALADGDAHINVLSIVGRRFFALCCMIIVWVVSGNPVFSYAISLAMAAVVASVVGRAVLQKRLPSASVLSLSSLIRLTWPYWLHSSATQFRNLDTMLVALVASPAQAGFYAVASRLTGPLRILPVSLAAVVLPGVARSKGAVSRRVALIIVSMLAIMTMLYVAVAMAAPWVIATFLGTTYSPAVLPVQIVCYGLIFGASASLLASVLQAQGKQKYVGGASVFASLYCVPAICVGSMVWGASGAALALVTSFALQTLVLLSAFMRRG